VTPRRDAVVADVFPQDEAALVKRLRDAGHVVKMGGDGAPGPSAAASPAVHSA